MTTYLLTLADSEVLDLSPTGDALDLRFAAAQVTETAPDGTRRTGYVRHLRLRLTGVTGELRPHEQLGRIAGGELSVSGQPVRPLQVPGRVDGPLLLVLDFANRAELQVRAASAEFSFSAPTQLHEHLSC